MPEWPELRVMQERIADALVGKKVVAVRVGDPVVLRAEKPVDELLVGRTLRTVTHHGKFLVFGFDGLEMTVNPMLAGIFSLQPVGAKATKDTRLRLEFEGGTELRYRDDVRMGKVYVGLDAPGYEDLGPDAGTLTWTESEFSARAKAKRSEVRNLLQDQTFVSGIGNAYATRSSGTRSSIRSDASARSRRTRCIGSTRPSGRSSRPAWRRSRGRCPRSSARSRGLT